MPARDLYVTYATWKDIAQDDENGYSVYHVSVGTNNLTAITGNRDFIFITQVDASSYSDWNTNFSSVSTSKSSVDDAIACIVGLTTKATPRTRDGRPIWLPSTIGDEDDVAFTGAADDVENGTRLGGDLFSDNITTQGNNVYEFQFIERIDVSGGGVHCHGGTVNDYLHYEIYAPATAADNSSGDFDKYNLGGEYNMFIPANPGEGAWDIDLEETYNENVSFLKIVPVPANGTGYFDYNCCDHDIAVNYTGTGNCNLFDFPITLTRIINKFCIMGDDCQHQFLVPASYGAKRLAAQYKHKVTIYASESSPNISIMWWLFLGRGCTQP